MLKLDGSGNVRKRDIMQLSNACGFPGISDVTVLCNEGIRFPNNIAASLGTQINSSIIPMAIYNKNNTTSSK